MGNITYNKNNHGKLMVKDLGSVNFKVRIIVIYYMSSLTGQSFTNRQLQNKGSEKSSSVFLK